MADLAKEFKNLDKDKDELLLEEVGAIDSDGVLTSGGKTLLMEVLAAENRSKLLGAAKKINAAREKVNVSPVNIIEEDKE